ncbi:MAG: hypothetical protein ABJA66_02385 [Actinomycetota bacterium]
MRLSIRAEQMSVIEAVTQENFVRRIVDHLLDEYPKAQVILPGDEKFTVDQLPAETLYDLVRTGIARARGYGITFESSIAAYTAVMFEVSPNFDTHRLCQVLLNDEEVEPNNRLDEVLNVLTEKNWESIRADYDPNAWKPEMETDDGNETQGENKANPNEPKNLDLEATVIVKLVE